VLAGTVAAPPLAPPVCPTDVFDVDVVDFTGLPRWGCWALALSADAYSLASQSFDRAASLMCSTSANTSNLSRRIDAHLARQRCFCGFEVDLGSLDRRCVTTRDRAHRYLLLLLRAHGPQLISLRYTTSMQVFLAANNC
jgi:hypothetical protein